MHKHFLEELQCPECGGTMGHTTKARVTGATIGVAAGTAYSCLRAIQRFRKIGVLFCLGTAGVSIAAPVMGPLALQAMSEIIVCTYLGHKVGEFYDTQITPNDFVCSNCGLVIKIYTNKNGATNSGGFTEPEMDHTEEK